MSPDENNEPEAPAKRLCYREGVIESDDLFADRNEVEIHHEDQVYRLRITKNGKLILNK
jgi:hemin uptake protein HemP